MRDKIPDAPKRTWPDKFRDAFGGIGQGARGQSSFTVHFVMAAAVVVAATLLAATALQWCILLLCITIVLVAEMFNTSLECLAKGLADRPDRNVGKALEIASGAVLLASIGAAAVGAIVFIGLLP